MTFYYGKRGTGVIRLALIIAAIVALAQPVLASDDESALCQFEWLPGAWVSQQGETVITETWARVSPLTFDGAGLSKSKNSTSSETLRLVQMGDEIYYIAKVAHNKFPVAFRLSDSGPGRFVFTNPGHDFPKRIVYAHTATDAMTVTVSDGGKQGFELKFIRADPPADNQGGL